MDVMVEIVGWRIRRNGVRGDGSGGHNGGGTVGMMLLRMQWRVTNLTYGA